ncbi:MAG: TVP38/TMEM64 family protein, partial [Gammaproteobacteria bacterium]|nr:TVP38/TMEM64 family protein [Gammaproteobacteria bacterium]
MKYMPRILFALVIFALFGAYFLFDLQRFFNLDFIKTQQAAIETWRLANPTAAFSIYTLIYIAVTALSLPGAVIMTLAGGAIFGLFWGTVIISFASSIGATLAFLIARFLLQDWVQTRFGDRLKAINEGVRKDGAFYLFTLRLVPVFPFFVINLVMAMTPMRARTFYWVSQIGMLMGTIVYVNAG